jgi:hypothetical protein
MLVVVATLGASLLFWAVPSARPMVVKRWMWASDGLKLAHSPREAVDGFKKCIRDRNYEALATLYLTGDYGEQMRKATNAAKKLGEAVDDLTYNVKEVAHLNAPNGLYALSLLDPFPKDLVEQTNITEEGSDKAYIVLRIDNDAVSKAAYQSGGWTQGWQQVFSTVPGQKITWSMIPVDALGADGSFTLVLKHAGEKDKAWKVEFPVTPNLAEKVDYLVQNYGNYMRALENLKYSVKHDAATKADFEADLRQEIDKAK